MYQDTCMSASRNMLSVLSSSEEALGKRTVKMGHHLQNSLFCQPLFLEMLGNIQGIIWRPSSILIDPVISCWICQKLGALGESQWWGTGWVNFLDDYICPTNASWTVWDCLFLYCYFRLLNKLYGLADCSRAEVCEQLYFFPGRKLTVGLLNF